MQLQKSWLIETVLCSAPIPLGLSIVKEIMQQHEGGIEIQGEINQGTTVSKFLSEAFGERGFPGLEILQLMYPDD